MKSLTLIALAALSVGAFAQKAKPAPTKIHCAVMTNSTVDIAKATKAGMYADYKGKRYFFCCGGCPESFKASPDKYAKKAESIPTPKK